MCPRTVSVCNSSTHTNYTPHESVYFLATKHYSIRYSAGRSNSYAETKYCQQTSFPNADFHYYWVNIVEFCRERWFGEFIKTLKIYSRHLSEVSTQLHFHHRSWITRWELILYHLQQVCFCWTEMYWKKCGVEAPMNCIM